jgi:TetR/AcrR family transcriptional repressor of nem operon
MKPNAKTRILKAGARLVHLKGFNHTGLQEVLEEARVPKGSFYYYFKSKEDLGLSLVDYFAENLKTMRDALSRDDSLTNLEKIRAIFKWQAESFKKAGFKGGCPIGNLALEMADCNPKFRKKLEQAFKEMKNDLAVYLEKARKAGEINESTDVAEIAAFIVSSWEGALMQMKVAKSTTPHAVFDRMVFQQLIKA